MQSDLKKKISDPEADGAAEVTAVVKDFYEKFSPEQEKSSVCALLKKTRQRQRKALEEVASTLRVSRNYLEAIEEGMTEKLPERVYTLGFLQAYSNFLGLDSEKILKDFKVEVLGDPLKEELAFFKPSFEPHAPRRSMFVLSFILVLGGFGVWYLLSAHHGHPIDATPEAVKALSNSDYVLEEEAKEENLTSVKEDSLSLVPVEESEPDGEGRAVAVLPRVETGSSVVQSLHFPVEASQPASSGQISGTTQEKKNPVPIQAPLYQKVELVCADSVWVEVKNEEGHVWARKIFKSGETYAIPDFKGAHLTIGNASAVHLVIDGRQGPALGQVGEVKKMHLTNENLVAYLK